MFHFWGKLGIIEPIGNGNGFLQATVEALGRYGFALWFRRSAYLLRRP